MTNITNFQVICSFEGTRKKYVLQSRITFYNQLNSRQHTSSGAIHSMIAAALAHGDYIIN